MSRAARKRKGGAALAIAYTLLIGAALTYAWLIAYALHQYAKGQL